MKYQSILFKDAKNHSVKNELAAPDFFTDLNLDQIVKAITTGKEEYNLMPYFYVSLHNEDDVIHRQEIMKDLEEAKVLHDLKVFAASMQEVRKNLVETKKQYHERQIERWFVDAVNIYANAVMKLSDDLSAGVVKSHGLKVFRHFLKEYCLSKRFTTLSAETKQIEKELASIRYKILIKGLRVEVDRYTKIPDYGTKIKGIFERFSQGAVKKYRFKFSTLPQMNQVEEMILDLVAKIYHDTFSKLALFYGQYKDFFDAAIVQFDREIQFYISYHEYISKFKKIDLQFCYPKVSKQNKEINIDETFDLALADKLQSSDTKPVVNDFYLKDGERVIVVTGPNQGGKTTFSRTFGQLHYLASLGLPVPGSNARLYLPDRIFSHYERMEKMANLRGKLQDDLIRLHEIIEAATPESIILINEIFTSTTLQDAIALSRKIASAIANLDALCVWVTFIDEVSTLNKKTVSMVSTVNPNNPVERTFKIIRQPANGLAFARSIAQKYQLTYDLLKRRLKQ